MMTRFKKLLATKKSVGEVSFVLHENVDVFFAKGSKSVKIEQTYANFIFPKSLKDKELFSISIDLTSSIFELKHIEMLLRAISNRISKLELVINLDDFKDCNHDLLQSIIALGVSEKRIRFIISSNSNNFKNVLNYIETNRFDVKKPCMQFTFSKTCIVNIDDYYSLCKTKDINCRFIPKSISLTHNDIIIDEAILSDDEKYNVSLFYHKQLEEDKLEIISRRFLNDLKEVFYCVESKSNRNKIANYSRYFLNRNISFKDYWSSYTSNLWKGIYERDNYTLLSICALILYGLKKAFSNKKTKKVLIVGWYGTETVGDKAILGAIIEQYKKDYEKVEFIIGSLYPYISIRTVKELGINAKVVNTQNIELLKYSILADDIVMGGGPLMDLHFLYVPHLSFKIGKTLGNKTIVYGCGLGPLNNDKHIKTVKSIFKLSDTIMLRDTNSIKLANSWGFTDVTYSGDPAKKYILGTQMEKDVSASHDEKVLACFLRKPLRSFYKNISDEEYTDLINQFEYSFSCLINEFSAKNNIDKVIFYHMHNFIVGGDDRDYSRYLKGKYFLDNDIVDYDRELSTVKSISRAMKSSSFNICMRFHSVLFADTLNTEYVAIDYTNGGKIKGFLKDQNKLEKLITINDLISNNKTISYLQ